jgi:F-type H+-transporting ATPase subunit delta
MKLSRRQTARWLADQLLHSNRQPGVQRAAAWLLVNRQPRAASYLAADVSSALSQRGYLSVRIISAQPLVPATRRRLTAFLRLTTGAKQLEIETQVDPQVIGGVRIEIPGAELDATVQRAFRDFTQRLDAHA